MANIPLSIPPGTCTLEAAFPGLEVSQTVQVETSKVRVPVELKPIEVTSSVVARSDQRCTPCRTPGSCRALLWAAPCPDDV